MTADHGDARPVEGAKKVAVPQAGSYGPAMCRLVPEAVITCCRDDGGPPPDLYRQVIPVCIEVDEDSRDAHWASFSGSDLGGQDLVARFEVTNRNRPAASCQTLVPAVKLRPPQPRMSGLTAGGSCDAAIVPMYPVPTYAL